MLTEHAKVMKALAAAGEITGRKKLQKMIYIAKKLDFPFYEKFDFHFYGPYSEELTCRVEELCALGFLHETKEKKAAMCNIAIRSPKRVSSFCAITTGACRALTNACK